MLQPHPDGQHRRGGRQGASPSCARARPWRAQGRRDPRTRGERPARQSLRVHRVGRSATDRQLYPGRARPDLGGRALPPERTPGSRRALQPRAGTSAGYRRAHRPPGPHRARDPLADRAGAPGQVLNGAEPGLFPGRRPRLSRQGAHPGRPPHGALDPRVPRRARQRPGQRDSWQDVCL